jgi:hypothetical protein
VATSLHRLRRKRRRDMGGVANRGGQDLGLKIA